MFVNIIIILSISTAISSELIAPGIDRSIPDGVKSLSYQIVYGDQDLRIVNEVVQDVEKTLALKKDKDVFDSIDPLPAEDVKCLMSADKYCSKDMKAMKEILIEAVRNDCKNCLEDQKDKAGRVIATMLIHHSVAWKMFLTRAALEITPNINTTTPEEFDFKIVGKPEEIQNSKYRIANKGTKVRVRRYAMEIIPKNISSF